MDSGTVLKFLHVVSAVAMVAGLIARDLVLGRARRSKDLAQTELLLQISNPFEKMVVFGSVSVLVFGIVTMLAQSRRLYQAGSYWLPTSVALFATTLVFVPTVFIPKGKRFERTLEEARQGGEVTAELESAFADGAVAFARNYEFVVTGIIFALMVLKPF